MKRSTIGISIIGAIIGLGIFFISRLLVNSAFLQPEVGNAVLVNHQYVLEHEELDVAFFTATKIWRNITVPTQYYLLLEVERQQDLLHVDSGTYSTYPDGTVFQVVFKRGRLDHEISIKDFYRGLN